MSKTAVGARGLGKRYLIYGRPMDRLLGRRDRAKEHWALRDIELDVPQGRCLGIIGANGAGKSTLLKLLTGVIRPSEGSLWLRDMPLALLELGTGFNLELTGRDNLFATGALLGHSAEVISRQLEAIRAFADIGDYFDRPVKTYSSGMLVRLAFSLYVHLDCEVLIVDEALSVGDFFFQQKCAAALRAIQQRGTTILFVSHDTAAVQELADEAVLLNQGRIVARGDANSVISRYHILFDEKADRSKAPVAPVVQEAFDDVHDAAWRLIDRIRDDDIIAAVPSLGQGGARILAARITDENGNASLSFPAGSRARFEAVIEAKRAIPHANLGVLVADDQHRTVWACANSNQGLSFGRMECGDLAVVSLDLSLDLPPGNYSVSLTAGEFDPADPAYSIRHDVKVRSIEVKVTSSPERRDRTGLVYLPMEISAL